MFRKHTSRSTILFASSLSLCLLVVGGILFFTHSGISSVAFATPSGQSALAPQLAQKPAATPTTNVFATSAPKLSFPDDLHMQNVKTAFGAKGDGVTDDTAAIQRALNEGRTTDQDYNGLPKALYFPEGTYLVSASLNWRGCCMTLQGQGSKYTTIKLKNGATSFSNPQKPQAVIVTPSGNMSFRENIWNIAINTGSNNPGAIGLDYISNNIGSIEDVAIVSQDGQGYSGLDMTRSWPGPCYVKMLSVSGFRYGITVAQAEYGPTLEHILLTGQSVAGIHNASNILAIRDLQSTNRVPAIQNTERGGGIILLDGQLQGGNSQVSAIENNGYLYARHVVTTGYRSALLNKGTVVPGTTQNEYLSDKAYTLFNSSSSSLNLAVAETPTFNDSNLANWVAFKPGYYGDTAPLQGVLNSGKSTVYFPFGAYLVGKTVVTVPATVKRIVGFSSIINSWASGGGLTFKVIGQSTTPLVIEGFGYGVTVELASSRPVSVRHGAYSYTDTQASGDLFLEDTGGNLNVVHPHNVWARQLNSEGSTTTQVVNNGGTVWILGIKTEGTATVIDTRSGGKTELLGTLIYPAASFSASDSKRPAFKSTDATISVLYGGSSYVQNGFYTILVQDTRAGVTKQLLASQVNGRVLLYSGR